MYYLGIIKVVLNFVGDEKIYILVVNNINYIFLMFFEINEIKNLFD